MNTLKNKIKSKHGASMLLALMFLFFCMTIGAITLTAATTNVGKTGRISNQEQDYMAVSSAARLLEKELADMKFEGNYVHKKDITYSSSGGSTITDRGKSFSSASLTTAVYAKSLLEDDFTRLYKGIEGLEPSYTPPARTMEFTLDKDKFPKVEAEIKVNKDYSVQIVLKSKDSDSNKMTMKFKPAKEESDRTEYVPTSDTVTTETTTYTTKVTFSSATITKGGGS